MTKAGDNDDPNGVVILQVEAAGTVLTPPPLGRWRAAAEWRRLRAFGLSVRVRGAEWNIAPEWMNDTLHDSVGRLA